jgi:prepilin-type N-terminal cleavage/methylation domain-containing protein
MNTMKKKREEGFTIIEVLIVLAIAGLIILIVFLAVPALQRNSRNTTYKNDAAALLSATTEFVNNNNGKVPVSGDSATVKGNAKTQAITNLNISTGTVTAITPTFDTATVVTGVKCGALGGTSITPTAASTRSLVIIYAVESSSGAVVAQCTES